MWVIQVERERERDNTDMSDTKNFTNVIRHNWFNTVKTLYFCELSMIMMIWPDM